MEYHFFLSELVDFLRGTLKLEVSVPEEDFLIKGFSPISSTREGTLSWMKEQDIDWTQLQCSVVLCGKGAQIPENSRIVFLPVEKPRLVFARVLQKFAKKDSVPRIEDTVVIGKNCSIAQGVSIGHYTVIGNDVQIGQGTVIKSGVHIYDNVRIGENCLIHSGVVIGSDGFGFEKDEMGRYSKLLHIGGVTIEDDVEIGSNSCIDRGTLSDTILRNNVKIDNLCHIAHNVEVGENSVITAMAMLAGSITLGKNVWVGPSSAIMQGKMVGDNALIGLGAVVVKNVEPDDVVAGVPARSFKKA